MNRATRTYADDSDSARAREATSKLARQVHEATVPTITAAAALKDAATLTNLVATAALAAFYDAPMEEMQLAAHLFLWHSGPQLVDALRADKAAMLGQHADKL